MLYDLFSYFFDEMNLCIVWYKIYAISFAYLQNRNQMKQEHNKTTTQRNNEQQQQQNNNTTKKRNSNN